MGQKTNPIALRLGINKNWSARWFFGDKYGQFLEEDEIIRRTIMSKISQAGVAAIEIERTSNSLRIFIKAARPGFIIGRGGKGVEELSKALETALKKYRKTNQRISLSLNIEELKRTEVSAAYVAQQIAWDIEKRLPYRRTMKKYLDQIMQNKEVKGAKILLSGRLDGNEIARREWLGGNVPLQTLRADIDYGRATAFCTYGAVGVKVWIYKGELFDEKKKNQTN